MDTDHLTTTPHRSTEPQALTVARLVEREERLDPVARQLRNAASRYDGGRFGDAMRGRWLGHALHPLLTDLPLGCWTASALLDLTGARRHRVASQRLVALGLVAAVPTAVSGVAEVPTIADHRALRVATAHAGLNAGVMLCYAWSWRHRRRGHLARGVAWGIVGGAIAMASGYLGGHLSLVCGIGHGARGAEESSAESSAPQSSL